MRKIKVTSWCLYDFATTMFMMNIVSLAFVQWIEQNFGHGDTYYGIISAIVYVLNMLLYPIAGEMCDRGWKLIPLAVVTLIFAVGTFLIGFCHSLWIGAALFAVSYLTYQLGFPYYVALIDDISEPEQFGVVSGLGVGARYSGAIVGLIIVNFFIYTSLHSMLPAPVRYLLVKPQEKSHLCSLDQKHRTALDAAAVSPEGKKEMLLPLSVEFGQKGLKLSTDASVKKAEKYWILEERAAKRAYLLVPKEGKLEVYEETNYANVFVPTAVLCLVFSLPLFLAVRRKKKSMEGSRSGPRFFKSMFDSMKSILQSKNTMRFMLTVFLGGIPLYATVHFMTVFLKEVGGIPDSMLTLFLIVATVFSVIGGVGFGFSLRPLGNKRAFNIVLFLWFAVLLIGSFSQSRSIMWAIGALAGVGMGGFWALSRILALKLSPEGKEGSYLSFYSMILVLCGLFSSLLWPLGVWISTALSLPFTPQRASTLLLSIIGLTALFVFFPVRFPEEKKTDNPSQPS